MKRLKKILKWTGIVLGGLVAIGLVANAVFVWTTDTRLERQLAAIRAAGDPLTLAELAPKPIPPEEERRHVSPPRQGGHRGNHGRVHAPEVLAFRTGQITPYPVPLEVQKTLQAAFDAHPKAIPLLEQAAACPGYDPQFDYSVSAGFLISKMNMPIQELRANAIVLQLRVWLLLAEGKRDEAMRMALVVFRLANHCNRVPTLVPWLVAIAFRQTAAECVNLVLQTGPVSNGLRETLDAELAVQERMEGYAWALKTDRPFMLSEFDMVPGATSGCIVAVVGTWRSRRFLR